ncbi:MAG: glycosyltransferase [Proteobacteria bacterium]|nr:glycosyltransferase [Pseudomonadota bacterium]
MTKPEGLQPHCDVVVVNYNAGNFLARCVDSVLRTEVPVSLTIVDNASADESLERVRALDSGQHQLHIIENSQNLGFSKAVNLGAKQGASPFVLLLNPDCEIYPHTIGNLLAEAGRCEDFGILGALVFNEDGTEQRGCRRLEPTFTRSMVTALHLGKYFQSVNLQYSDLPEQPQSLDAVSGSSMLIDRTVFEALGGMDEGYFLHVEDLDICRRVREFGKKVYFTPNVSLFHHHGASSHGVPYKTEWYKHQGMLRYQSKFQKPHQSALRSWLTRGVVYMNFALSIVRQHLARRGKDDPYAHRLINEHKPVLVTGASSDLGQAVLHKLKDEPSVIALSRGNKFPKRIANERWFSWSFFEKVPQADFSGADVWIALSPIWSAAEMATTLQTFGGVGRVIALSSTSILGKADTASAKEQAVVQQLVDGEQRLLQWGESVASKITICRASMVYGGENNQNIAFVKRMIRIFRFFPMLSQGNGLRQPVHIDDLAAAVLSLIPRRALAKSTYILAGGEQLSYRAMIERVFQSLGQKPRFWVISKGIFKGLLNGLSIFPGLGFLNREMIARMENDLVYDVEPARRDFEYAPGMFRPGKID